MENQGFDQEIRDILQQTFSSALVIGEGSYTPEQVKLMILATNLDALAKTFLKADEDDRFNPDFKQVALALFGTSDWIRESFTDIDLL